ncbi:hypothetical protein EYF80_044783 [Liparis tanakae]|uniref:Uncharacterized protein n=1 Tax=Liparis tanakae TaxID=230148 RepID=A0A4Z2FVH1_9TELE|nr:hypothetical protein EYF80_044783 [Liparis tanakae]
MNPSPCGTTLCSSGGSHRTMKRTMESPDLMNRLRWTIVVRQNRLRAVSPTLRPPRAACRWTCRCSPSPCWPPAPRRAAPTRGIAPATAPGTPRWSRTRVSRSACTLRPGGSPPTSTAPQSRTSWPLALDWRTSQLKPTPGRCCSPSRMATTRPTPGLFLKSRRLSSPTRPSGCGADLRSRSMSGPTVTLRASRTVEPTQSFSTTT